jgi:hypothetical protein
MSKKLVIQMVMVALATSLLSACDDNSNNDNCRSFGPTGAPVTVDVNVEGATAEGGAGGEGGDGGNVANQGGEINELEDNTVDISGNSITPPVI